MARSAPGGKRTTVEPKNGGSAGFDDPRDLQHQVQTPLDARVAPPGGSETSHEIVATATFWYSRLFSKELTMPTRGEGACRTGHLEPGSVGKHTGAALTRGRLRRTSVVPVLPLPLNMPDAGGPITDSMSIVVRQLTATGAG